MISFNIKIVNPSENSIHKILVNFTKSFFLGRKQIHRLNIKKLSYIIANETYSESVGNAELKYVFKTREKISLWVLKNLIYC